MALVLFIRTFAPGVLILLLFAVLLQLIVIEQHIPLKRIIRQIEQIVVIKRGCLPCRLASIHHTVEKSTDPCGRKFILSAPFNRLPQRLRDGTLADKIGTRMAPVAAGLANSDTRFHREKWPSSLTRGRPLFIPMPSVSNVQTCARTCASSLCKGHSGMARPATLPCSRCSSCG